MSPAAALSDVVRTRELNLWNTAHRTRLNSKRQGDVVEFIKIIQAIGGEPKNAFAEMKTAD